MILRPRTLVVLIIGLPLVGCAAARSNTVSHLRGPETDAEVELSHYFPSAADTRRTFLRTDLSHPDEPSVPYTQTEVEHGRIEGLLTGVEWPLSRYVDPHSNRPDRPRFPWPTSGRRSAQAFFVEFSPPVAQWPEAVRKDAPIEWKAAMEAYDGRGVPFADGSAARRVSWEGYETIESGDAVYADCLRLHVETDLHFGWWASFRVRETVWLATRLGIIRRIERISGQALLLLRFDSAYEYNLQTHALDAATADSSPAPPRRWAGLAIYLDRSLPRPRIGGLAVEWARESDANVPPGADASR